MFDLPNEHDRVLVTGATGFTGKHLLRKLCAQGCDVHAIARPSSNRDDLDDLPVTWHMGDVYAPDVVHEAMRGANYVFHVAAAFRENKISNDVYAKVHVESTQLLAAKALEQPDFKRFVHVSTIGVHGHVANPPADEEGPFSTGDIYQETKLEGELWIREFAAEKGLPLTVVRPAMIYGPGDRRFLKVFKLAALPVVPVLGYGRGWMHLIHVDDLTDFMLHVVNRQDTLQQVYICGNTEPILLRDAVKVINRKLGKNSPIVRMPASPFFALGYLCEKIFPPLKMEPPIFRRRVAFFTKDRYFDTSKMQKTGFKPKQDNIGGLDAALQWYLEHHWI